MREQDIFLDSLPTSARSYLGLILKTSRAETFFNPCAGRFTGVSTALASGIKHETIYASDVSLLTSCIGYLADPEKKFDDLGIEVDSTLPAADSVRDDLDLVSQLIVSMKFDQLQVTTQRELNLRRQLIESWVSYRGDIKSQIILLLQKIRGIHYDIADVFDVAAGRAASEMVFFTIDGYAKLAVYESRFKWAGAKYAPYDSKKFNALLTTISCPAAVYIEIKNDRKLPEGWSAAWKQPKGQAAHAILSNYEIESGVLVRKPSDMTLFPVYEDEEITESSVVQMRRTDKQTCLYFRDLFIHKLGQTTAEYFYLMMIDGRVVTAFGLHRRDLQIFKSRYMGEVFGISRTSQRYKFMGKLFMLLLTSGEMRETICRNHNFWLHDPLGIETSSITSHEEGKTDRGVMNLYSRVALPHGRFHVCYRGDFRKDTFSDVVKMWLKRWGGRSRVQKNI